jgi:hypothetical protein
MTLGREFHFIVHDVEGDAAAWSPREVAIHTSTDLEGRLIFVLENPTPRTHVFETPGLFEQVVVEGSENKTIIPMRVYVAPGEIVHVQVSTEQLSCEPETDGLEAQTCPFFCPLHKVKRPYEARFASCPRSLSNSVFVARRTRRDQIRGRRLGRPGSVFAGIRWGLFRAENDVVGRGSFAVVERPLSDRLLAQRIAFVKERFGRKQPSGSRSRELVLTCVEVLEGF